MLKKTCSLWLELAALALMAAAISVVGAAIANTPAVITFTDGDVSLYRFQSDFNFAGTFLGPAYVDGLNNVQAFLKVSRA